MLIYVLDLFDGGRGRLKPPTPLESATANKKLLISFHFLFVFAYQF
jgi:hypothetical protein